MGQLLKFASATVSFAGCRGHDPVEYPVSRHTGRTQRWPSK